MGLWLCSPALGMSLWAGGAMLCPKVGWAAAVPVLAHMAPHWDPWGSPWVSLGCWPTLGSWGIPVGQPGMLPCTGGSGESLWGSLGCCPTPGSLRSPWGDPMSAGQPGQVHGQRLVAIPERGEGPGIPGIPRRAHRGLWQLRRAESPRSPDSPKHQATLQRCRGQPWPARGTGVSLRGDSSWDRAGTSGASSSSVTHPVSLPRVATLSVETGSSFPQLDMHQSLEPPGQQPPGCGKCSPMGSDAGKAAGCSGGSRGSGGGIGKGPVICSAVW